VDLRSTTGVVSACGWRWYTRASLRVDRHRPSDPPEAFFPPSDAKFKPAATHALTQPRRSAEGGRSVLPVRWGRSDSCPSSTTTRRHPTKPTRDQLKTPPARGHATKCPVSPGAPCLLLLRSSPIESLVLVSAPPVRRSVARLATPSVDYAFYDAYCADSWAGAGARAHRGLRSAVT
jgi:hypothetical protein